MKINFRTPLPPSLLAFKNLPKTVLVSLVCSAHDFMDSLWYCSTANP